MKISELSLYEHKDQFACSLHSLYSHVTRNTVKRMAAYFCKNLENKGIHIFTDDIRIKMALV